MCGLYSVELDARASEREDIVSCLPEVGAGEEYMLRGAVLATGASPWRVAWVRIYRGGARLQLKQCTRGGRAMLSQFFWEGRGGVAREARVWRALLHPVLGLLCNLCLEPVHGDLGVLTCYWCLYSLFSQSIG